MTLRQKIGRWIYARRPVSRRTVDMLRMEVRFWRQRTLNTVVPWRRAKIARLRALRGVLLNVGSGGRGKAGWINFDASPYHADIYCTYDIRRPLPFADGSVHRILAEHVMEHLDYHDDIPKVLAECFRVLEPGGIVRIIVPDAQLYLEAYVRRDPELMRRLGLDASTLPKGMLTPMEMINHVFHQGGEHCFAWDFDTMEAVLRRAGFQRVVKQAYRSSLDPELAIDLPHHAPYSLYADAVK